MKLERSSTWSAGSAAHARRGGHESAAGLQGLAVVDGALMEGDHLAVGRKHDPGQDQVVGFPVVSFSALQDRTHY